MRFTSMRCVLLVLTQLTWLSMVSTSNIPRNDVDARQLLGSLETFVSSLGSDLGITSTAAVTTAEATSTDAVATSSSSTESISTSKTTKTSSTGSTKSNSPKTSTSSSSLPSSSSTTFSSSSSSTSTSTSISTSTTATLTHTSSATASATPSTSSSSSSGSSISTAGIAIAAIFGLLIIAGIIYLIFKFSPRARALFVGRQDRKRAERSYRLALDGSDDEEGLGMAQRNPSNKGLGIGVENHNQDQDFRNERERHFSFAFNTSATYLPPGARSQSNVVSQHFRTTSNPSTASTHSRPSQETLVSPISQHSSTSYGAYKPIGEVRASRIGLAVPLQTPRLVSVQRPKDKGLPPLPIYGSSAGGRAGEGLEWDGRES